MGFEDFLRYYRDHPLIVCSLHMPIHRLPYPCIFRSVPSIPHTSFSHCPASAFILPSVQSSIFRFPSLAFHPTLFLFLSPCLLGVVNFSAPWISPSCFLLPLRCEIWLMLVACIPQGWTHKQVIHRLSMISYHIEIKNMSALCVILLEILITGYCLISSIKNLKAFLTINCSWNYKNYKIKIII